MLHLAAHGAHENVLLVQEVDHFTRNTETSNEDRSSALDDGLDTGVHLVGQGSEQIDAEWFLGSLANQAHFFGQFMIAHRGCAERADATSFTDCRHQFVVGHASHAREHDGIVDSEHLGESCAHVARLVGAR
jgi:hypothetical protein